MNDRDAAGLRGPVSSFETTSNGLVIRDLFLGQAIFRHFARSDFPRILFLGKT
jgi:hypothetical protein